MTTIITFEQFVPENDSALFTFKNLYKAYLDCRKNKRNKQSALGFEVQAEDNLIRLQKELETRTYHPSTSVCFIASNPKMREIFAANFRDRIAHHLLVSYLEKLWEPVFIYDSYACRKNRGTHLAVKRLQGFIRKVTANNTKNAYYLHVDIKNFFMSIDKKILYNMLCKRCPNDDARWLAKNIIFHDCTNDYTIKGDRSLFSSIPKHKSLFGNENIKGLPIGNYTSQFFANIYLNCLDLFVKHKLKCKYYQRYVDDLILLSNAKRELENWKDELSEFLKELVLTHFILLTRVRSYL